MTRLLILASVKSFNQGIHLLDTGTVGIDDDDHQALNNTALS